MGETFQGALPTRIIVDREGKATTAREAAERYFVESAIVFIRNDGWTLGAPAALERVAYRLWEDAWVGFVKNGKLYTIEEYQPELPFPEGLGLLE